MAWAGNVEMTPSGCDWVTLVHRSELQTSDPWRTPRRFIYQDISFIMFHLHQGPLEWKLSILLTETHTREQRFICPSVSEHLTSWKQGLSEFCFDSSVQLLVLFMLSKIPDGGTVLSTPKPGSIALTSTFFISWLTSLLAFAFWTSSSGIKSQKAYASKLSSLNMFKWHADKSLEEWQKMQKQVRQDMISTPCGQVSWHDSTRAVCNLATTEPFCEEFP